MVIPEDRAKAAMAIAAYMRGDIDNFALDDALLGYTGCDKTIPQIGLGLWSAYDDIKRHKVSLNKAGWQLFRRCIAFLQTNLEASKYGRKSDPTSWPFQQRRDIFAARPTLKDFGLPKFDPSVHAIPIRGRATVCFIWFFWIVFAGALIFRLFTFLIP